MLRFETVEGVKKLLDRGGMTHREIAAATGVSHGTVGAIARGQRKLTNRRSAESGPSVSDRAPLPQADAKRCPECGGLVHLPCVLCRTLRARRTRSSAA